MAGRYPKKFYHRNQYWDNRKIHRGLGMDVTGAVESALKKTEYTDRVNGLNRQGGHS
jgi:hypothetical protein